MKKILIGFLALVTIFFGVANKNAQAASAQPFRGIYEIMDQQNPIHMEKPIYMLFDVDTMQHIWDHYGDGGKIPPDLEQYKDEMSILAAFTSNKFMILTLERLAMVGSNYIRIQGGGDTLMELQRQPDGTFVAATREKGQITRFKLAAPQPIE